MNDDAKPRLSSAMDAWASARAAEVLVCRSAVVDSVDTDGCVTLRLKTPIAEVVAGEPRWADVPLLPRIPVMYWRMGGITIAANVEIGDEGLALFRDVSHEEVDAGQGAADVVTPADPRRWDPVDVVFQPAALTIQGWSSSVVPASGVAITLPSGEALRVGSATASRKVAIADDTADRIERIESYLNTATYAVAGVVTSAPFPAPFTGASQLVPRSIASVVATPVARTTTNDVASDRILTDG